MHGLLQALMAAVAVVQQGSQLGQTHNSADGSELTCVVEDVAESWACAHHLHLGLCCLECCCTEQQQGACVPGVKYMLL